VLNWLAADVGTVSTTTASNGRQLGLATVSDGRLLTFEDDSTGLGQQRMPVYRPTTYHEDSATLYRATRPATILRQLAHGWPYSNSDDWASGPT